MRYKQIDVNEIIFSIIMKLFRAVWITGNIYLPTMKIYTQNLITSLNILIANHVYQPKDKLINHQLFRKLIIFDY